MSAPLSIADVLDRAADLIEPEGAWTQGTWARGPSEHPVPVFSEYAVCFCMRGALVKAASVSLADELRPINKALGFPSAAAMARWNDKPMRKQHEVVAKLREAAALARSTFNDADNQREEGK